MGNVFSSTSLTDYNLNPPSDDGAQTPANQVTWAKHKTKLTDPIKTQVSDLDTAVSTAFGKVQGGITAVSDDYTVLATDQGKLITQSGASKTITTPAAATVGAPFRFGILNIHASSSLTLDGNASETVDGAATITIPAGRGVIVETDGTNWYTHGQNWPTGVLIDLLGITFAQGDILYYDGSNIVNLGPGTSGQFLKTNGADANPAWANVTPVWTLIEEQVLGTAIASYDSPDLSAYEEIWVELINVRPASANANFLMRTGTSGAADSGASDYSWQQGIDNSGSNAAPGDAADSSIRLTNDGTDQQSTTGMGAFGDIFWKAFNQDIEAMCRWDIGYEDESAANSIIQVLGKGARLEAVGRNFLQLIYSTGNIAGNDGIIRLWGKS